VRQFETRQNSEPAADHQRTYQTDPIDRCVDLVLPAWQPPPEDGLVALVGPDVSAGWADRLLVRVEGGLLVWAATAADGVGQALAVARLPDTRVVVLLPGGTEARRAGLALEFARRLAAVGGDGSDLGWGVTSPARPEPLPDGVVRVPHLVSVRRGSVVTDTVVWEVAARERVEAWLGGPVPDLGFFERNLAGLLELRARARAGRLPATAAGMRLARLLDGRRLSIRLVYQRPGLFRVLLSGREDAAVDGDPAGSSPGRERVW
jgi:hypothetical protein